MIGTLWLFVGICFGIWFLEQILIFIYDFVIIFKNYLKE